MVRAREIHARVAAPSAGLPGTDRHRRAASRPRGQSPRRSRRLVAAWQKQRLARRATLVMPSPDEARRRAPRRSAPIRGLVLNMERGTAGVKPFSSWPRSSRVRFSLGQRREGSSGTRGALPWTSGSSSTGSRVTLSPELSESNHTGQDSAFRGFLSAGSIAIARQERWRSSSS